MFDYRVLTHHIRMRKKKTGSLASEFQFQRDCLQFHTSDPDVLCHVLPEKPRELQSVEVRMFLWLEHDLAGERTRLLNRALFL